MTPAPAETGQISATALAAVPPSRTGRAITGGVTASLANPATPLTIPGAWQSSLPGEPASVPAARRFIRSVLTGCPRVSDLAQAVTELAANAVKWSAAREHGTFTVTVRTAPRWARVEITDPGPATRPDPGTTPDSSGWGLPIVASVTDRHGTTHGPGTTRTAWAETTWPPTP